MSYIINANAYSISTWELISLLFITFIIKLIVFLNLDVTRYADTGICLFLCLKTNWDQIMKKHSIIFLILKNEESKCHNWNTQKIVLIYMLYQHIFVIYVFIIFIVIIIFVTIYIYLKTFFSHFFLLQWFQKVLCLRFFCFSYFYKRQHKLIYYHNLKTNTPDFICICITEKNVFV